MEGVISINMSKVNHDALVITCSGHIFGDRFRAEHPGATPDIDAFRLWLPEEWRPLVIGPVRSIVNNYVTFAFLPDGSKEDWDESDNGDRYRAMFAAMFRFRYEDGSSPFSILKLEDHGKG
jgi:hypothetical protein